MVDGNIQGELKLGKFAEAEGVRERERRLNEWLMEQGW
jgi:putative ABC transport system ATP-binding protein